MKEFITAAKEKVDEGTDDEGLVTWKVDGVECRARYPKDGQIGMVMAMTSRHMPESERIAGAVEFFASILDQPTYNHLISRLFDAEDDFGFEEVFSILEHLLEEWSGRPTQSPSGSTKSRSSAGRSSTRRTPAST